jgi:hypothetical protein
MRTLRVLIWTAALCAIIAPAAAASRADWDACESGDPDRVIACCTRIIQSPGATAKDTAIPHYNRGVAYKNKDDLDRSIADFAEAIRLASSSPTSTAAGDAHTSTRTTTTAPSPTLPR